MIFAVIFTFDILAGDTSSSVVVADSVVRRMDSVVSTIVSTQTVSISVSTISIGISIVTSIEDSGVSFSFGLTTFTASSAGNGYVGGVNTGSTLNSKTVVSSSIAIVSSSISIVSKTIVASQAISIAVVGIGSVGICVKNSRVGFSLSLCVDSSHENGKNCNKGLHVA